MPLNLFNVRLDPNSRQLFSTQNRFPDLRRVFREIAREGVDEAANYCLAGAKSIVPIDTSELRGTSLDDGQIRKSNSTSYTARVFVTNDTHTGNGHPQAANKLASLLDSGYNEQHRFMHRTQNSLTMLDFISIAAGSPTKNWIKYTEMQVNGGIQRYLNNIMGPRTFN